ncbi:MAG: N-acetylmuramoyl-L-alanine amidase [bacterium]|nr:N-acetylmuramoyl-L-alanine amidase [bacterium]
MLKSNNSASPARGILLSLFLVLIAPLFISEDLPAGEKKHTFTIKHINKKEYISHYDLVKKFGIESSFDIVSRKGKIYHKKHHAVFRNGYSYMLVDGMLEKSEYPVIRSNGEIFFPLFLGKELIKAFYPNTRIQKKRRTLVVEFKKAIKPSSANISRRKRDRKQYSGSSKDKISFIIIDPGHGGKDPGAIGKGGLKEKVITIKIARYLEQSLKRKLKGVPIRLTRRSDRFVELAKRTEYANKYLKKNRNGIFISIHVNASISKKISGYETYFLSQNPTNEDARNTAALENNVVILEDKSKGGKGYGDVDYIEAMMLTTQIQKESSLLANSIQKGMSKKVRKFKSRGVRKADFFVLRGSLMPAALVEVGFITNKKEVAYLKKRAYQKKVAEGVASGVISFIKKYNKMIAGR